MTKKINLKIWDRLLRILILVRKASKNYQIFLYFNRKYLPDNSHTLSITKYIPFGENKLKQDLSDRCSNSLIYTGKQYF